MRVMKDPLKSRGLRVFIPICKPKAACRKVSDPVDCFLEANRGAFSHSPATFSRDALTYWRNSARRRPSGGTQVMFCAGSFTSQVLQWTQFCALIWKR